jgi:hypothetical protein
MGSSSNQRTSFHRRVFREGECLSIESTCLHCGFRIIGSPDKSVDQGEVEHLSGCVALAEGRLPGKDKPRNAA